MSQEVADKQQDADVKQGVLDRALGGLLFAYSLGWLILPVVCVGVCCLDIDVEFKSKIRTGFFLAVCAFIWVLGAKCTVILLILRQRISRLWLRIVSFVFFLFFDVFLLVTLLATEKKRLPTWARISLATALIVVSFVLYAYAWLPLDSGYYPFFEHAWMVLVVCVLLLLIGRFSRSMVRSFVLLGLYLVCVFTIELHKSNVAHEITSIQSRLSETLKCPVSTESFKSKMTEGITFEQEPLKSLMVVGKIDVPSFRFEKSSVKIRKAYDDICKEHAEAISALRNAVKMSPQSISHPWNDEPYSIELPELKACRQAAQFLALEIMANPGRKDIIAKDNDAMMNLRDWMLKNPMLISYFVGMAIEAIRLNAICFSLEQTEYDAAEWSRLLGDTIRWDYGLACAFVEEALAHDCASDYAFSQGFSAGGSIGLEKVGKIKSLSYCYHFGVLTLLSNLFDEDKLLCWKYMERNVEIIFTEGVVEKEMAQNNQWLEHEIKTKGALLVAMVMPALDRALVKSRRINDQRTMTDLARKVIVARRRQDGKLLDSLEELGELPRDAVNGLPFVYEHGEIQLPKSYEKESDTFFGFRIYPAAKDSKDSNDMTKHAVYVPLWHLEKQEAADTTTISQ